MLFSQTNRLEQLAVNLCSETVQSYYNSHILRSSGVTRCHSGEGGGITDLGHHGENDENDPRDEIEENHYFDNRPIIDLISHPVSFLNFFLYCLPCIYLTNPSTMGRIWHKVRALGFEYWVFLLLDWFPCQG